MNQSLAQLALDDFLWAALPAPNKTPEPQLQPDAASCRLQRRLVYRHRLLNTDAPNAQMPALRLMPLPNALR